ncbi:signal peptide peptidase SppA [Candidatus Fermentibacteria bacterium]|nr:signal peptide peptidase SppA [Candidatus Fermentibacteria bacterium]
MRSSIVLMVFAVITAAGGLPGPEPLFDWTAYPEVGDADLVNPAGYALFSDVGLSIGVCYTDTSLEEPDRISLRFPGGGFSGWWCDEQSLRRFDSGAGIELFGGMSSVGVGYTWFDPTVGNSPWEGRKAWQLGYLLRPAEWLSLGAVRRSGADLPSREIDTEYRVGVAGRPLGDRLTVVANYRLESDHTEDLLTGGLEYRPLHGLAISAEAGEDFVKAGLSAELGYLTLSGTARSDENELSGGRAEITLTSRARENLLRGGGRFVRFTPAETEEERTRPFLGSVRPCFTDRMLLLHRLAQDPSVDGVILEVKKGTGSLAQAEELRGALQRLRARGKRIYVFLENAGNGDYYVASLADEIYVHPGGGVSFLGLSSFGFFARDFLDRIGIYPDMMHIGKYKSASDMLTRSSMSEAQREATTAYLGSSQEELVRGVSSGRGLEPAQLRLLMETGPHTPSRAVQAGLVDATAHSDEVEDLVEADLGRSVSVLPLERYSREIPVDREWGPQRHVAVVVASGAIFQGESGDAFPMGEVLGSESYAETLEEAVSEPGVAALVVRIDSPGGDGLASEDMLHALERAREKVPVVVSMGTVAGSGGYYMACGADVIFADHMTLTGSIGVIMGKFSVRDMLTSLGINTEEVAGAPRSGMWSMLRRFTEEERVVQRELLEDSYQMFVDRVAEGRGMTYSQVDSVARGRVWTGADALEEGLVDRIGGVTDAVMAAARMGGVEADPVPRVRIYPRPSFPGQIGLPGSMAFSDLEELLSTTGPLYLMQPVVME